MDTRTSVATLNRQASDPVLEQRRLARECLEAGDPRAAMAAADAAVELDPQDSASRFLRGRIHYRLREYHGAIDDCLAAIRAAERDGIGDYTQPCFLLMAASHAAAGEHEHARGALQHVGPECRLDSEGVILSRACVEAVLPSA